MSNFTGVEYTLSRRAQRNAFGLLWAPDREGRRTRMVETKGSDHAASQWAPTCAYDSLQRLQSAITETDPLVTQWGQNFTYDGWGNLLGASVAKGSAPTFSVTVNGLTNRITGQSYDANGNQGGFGGSYDVENRLTGAGTYPNYYQYTYDGSNKRVAKSKPLTWDDENGTVSGEELLMFYGAGGERLAEFTMSIVKFGTPSQWYLRFTEKKTLVWFGSKLLRDGKYAVIQDRLGSVRWRRDTTNNQTETADYYPYGQEKPSATTNDREKFATYLRDPESGLDYADQRYHNPGWGRFLTPDPYQASAGPGDPGSWNRYAYVEGDPVNFLDPQGLAKCHIMSWANNEAYAWCESTSGRVYDYGTFKYPIPPPRLEELRDYNHPWLVAANAEAARVLGPEIDRREDRILLNNAIGSALSLLGVEECAEVFGNPRVLGTLTMTAGGVLESLRASESYYFAGPGFPLDAVTNFDQVVVLGVRIRWDATIAINGKYRDDPRGLVHTVLHELGHVLFGLGFRGGTFIDDDGINNPDNQSRNNDEIWKKCFGPNSTL